jgi:hypothetical protein
MVKTPLIASDIDIACDGVPGWKLYELAAKIEDELDVPQLDWDRMKEGIERSHAIFARFKTSIDNYIMTLK